MQDDLTVLRTTSENRDEDFLFRYPSSEQAALVMIQLADLYFEKAVEYLLNTDESDFDDDGEFGKIFTICLAFLLKAGFS